MSNVIRLNRDAPKEQWLGMSNGATGVIIELMGLSGSYYAQTDPQRNMIVWLLEI